MEIALIVFLILLWIGVCTVCVCSLPFAVMIIPMIIPAIVVMGAVEITKIILKYLGVL